MVPNTGRKKEVLSAEKKTAKATSRMHLRASKPMAAATAPQATGRSGG